MVTSFLFFNAVSQHCHTLFPSVHKLPYSLSIKIFGLMSQPVAHSRSRPSFILNTAPSSFKQVSPLVHILSAEACDTINSWHSPMNFNWFAPLGNQKFDNWPLFNPGACFLVAIFVSRYNSQCFLSTLQNKYNPPQREVKQKQNKGRRLLSVL